MGIKERREAQREKLFSQFVSVEALIEYIANEEEMNIADVAADLEGLIKRSDDSSLPEYGSIDEAAIEFVPYSAELSRLNLMNMLSDTIGDCGHGDASDHHGWLRDALFPFLQCHGIDVPLSLPAWEPREVQPPKKAADDSTSGSPEKPFGPKERNTLLCVIAAILDQQGIDFCNPERGTAKKIEGWVSCIGASVSEETIKGILGKLSDAVSARSK